MGNQQERITMTHDNNFAYILGVFMGDGCVTNQHGVRTVFKMTTIDEDFAIAVRNSLTNMTVKNKPYITTSQDKRPNRNPTFQVTCVDKHLSETLISDTNDKTKIPDYVLTWDIELRKHFIAGLMDSEGYVCKKSTIPSDCNKLTNRSYFMGFKVCDPWAVNFAQILNSVGVKTGKLRYEKCYGNGTKNPIHFTVKMQSWVDNGMWFNIKRKQERVDTWKECIPYTERSVNPRRSSPETICCAS